MSPSIMDIMGRPIPVAIAAREPIVRKIFYAHETKEKSLKNEIGGANPYF